MICEACKRGIDHPRVRMLHRINETGVKGRWACDKCIHLFPSKKPDEEDQKLLDVLAEFRP